MNKTKYILGLVFFAFLSAMTLTSCQEKDEVSEFDNWKERNEQFIDSIARVAKANADGTWMVMKAYTMGDSISFYNDFVNYFVYVKKIETGSGTTYPMYNDSVRVHYSGRLIPTEQHPAGYCFGKSYSTNVLNEATDVPQIFCMNAVVVGFTTALSHMHEGDRWIVYVPYYLGYGTSEYTSATIPGYSTLIYDLKLAKIYRYKTDSNTSWH